MHANSAPTLLVVDDDEEIRSLLARYLSEHGFRILVAADGESMRASLALQAVDLIVLDLMLPGEDGLSLCRWLRLTDSTPVVFLTARDDRTERVVGLEVGGDDYVTKPFDPRELVARIRAILRRTRGQAEAPVAAMVQNDRSGDRFRFDGWLLDARSRRLLDPSGLVVELSPGEFDLLLVFVESPRRVLDRDHLLDRTRGRGFTPYDRSIDVQISRLRRKLERPRDAPALIRTVRGAGYVFAARVERG